MAPPFLTSTLDGSVELHAPAVLPPGLHWIGGCVGLKDSLDAVDKRKDLLPLSGIELRSSLS
jgi:hypothetical protein